MSKTISILLSFIAVMMAFYYLYWQGEIATEKADANFSAIGFSNTKTECSESSLSFFIENNRKEKQEYQITVALDDKIIKNNSVEIKPTSKEKIKPDSDLIENICDSKDFSKYVISVKENEKEHIIYKVIN